MLGLGLVLLSIILERFIFNRTQLKVNQDFENNICRHLLNITNYLIVQVLRFSCTRDVFMEKLYYI